MSDKIKGMPDVLRALKNIEINPEDFGAIGDSTTDDTVALQSAINHAYESGGFVSLTKNYGFTQLTLPTACVMRGKRRASLRHLGEGVAILSQATGNNLNTNIINTNFFANPKTTIMLDMSGFGLANIERCNFYAGGSEGIIVKLGRGDEELKTGYYNNFTSCYFDGSYSGAVGNLTVISLANSANSNRFTNCRFDFADTCVYGEMDTNNNIFISCAFENFRTAITTSGRAYIALGCRFEGRDGTTPIAFHVFGTGYFNSLFGSHFQGISNPNKFKDESNSKVNYYISDSTALLPETSFNSTNVKDVKSLTLTPHTAYFANPDGSLMYYGNDNTGIQRGLYFNDRGSRKKVQTVSVASNSTLANQPYTNGEFIFNSTTSRPMVHDGTSWKDMLKMHRGQGSPEGIVSASAGDFYMDETNSAQKLYFKISGNSSSGWKEVSLI